MNQLQIFANLVKPIFMATLLIGYNAGHAVEIYKPIVERYKPTLKRNSSPATIRLINEQGKETAVKVENINGAYVLEGDMVLKPEGVSSAIGVRKYLRWTDGIIRYQIEPNHPHRKEILRTINSLNKNTVLWYQETSAVNKNYISIVHGNGCYSGLGEPVWGDSYPVSIGDGCDYGRIIHELLHAAGLMHEQSRFDRDRYVTIQWDNIIPEKRD
jgi:hypothetical protein